MSLTQERLKELLHYDPETGVFTWKRRTTGKNYTSWNSKYAGKRAGNVNKPSGYVYIYVDNENYSAHRLAWLYMHGEFPSFHIDHADMDRANNASSNLRLATQSENLANTGLRADNTSGFKGIVLHKNRLHQKYPWQARLKRKSLGYYATAEEAASVRNEAFKAEFGKFARV